MPQGNEAAKRAEPTAQAAQPPPSTERVRAAETDRGANYVCPGSTAAISRSVHLSRLRRGFEECRACAHREELGNLRPAVRVGSPAGDGAESTWLCDAGIRATYLNELTRPVMLRLAETIGAMFWDDLSGAPAAPNGRCPIVVVGRDSRPMSPDLAAGTVAGLRRMGCHVIEVGQTTRPEFWFAVRHLEAFAGVWVNGVGADANCGGLDVVQGGRCWSSPGRLQELWGRKDIAVTRPQSRNGTLATFQPSRPYLAGLRKHFHAFRPLSIVFCTGDRLLKGYFKSLLEESPINAVWKHGIPVFEAGKEESPTLAAVQERLYSHPADAVISIDEDAQTCRLWDERGRAVAPLHMLRPMLEMVERRRQLPVGKHIAGAMDVANTKQKKSGPSWLRARTAFVRSQGPRACSEKLQPPPLDPVETSPEQPPCEAAHLDKPRVVVGTGSLKAAEQMGVEIAAGGETLESMSKTMLEHSARLGLDDRGAFWFDESGPTSDALLTVSRVLQWLSSSDLPLSRLWAE